MRLLMAGILVALAALAGYLLGSYGQQSAGLETSSLGIPPIATAGSAPKSQREAVIAESKIAELTDELADTVAARNLSERRLRETKLSEQILKRRAHYVRSFYECERRASSRLTEAALQRFANVVRPTGLKGKLSAAAKRGAGILPGVGDMLALGASFYDDQNIRNEFAGAQLKVREARASAERACLGQLRKIRTS